MSFHRLVAHPSNTLVAIAWGRLFTIIDSSNGKVLLKFEDVANEEEGVLPLNLAHSDWIRDLTFSNDLLVTLGEDKTVKTWSWNSVKLVSSRFPRKRGNAITTTKDRIIVADRFGDVLSMTLNSSLIQDAPQKKDEEDDEQEGSEETNGKVLLGHVSMLTSVIMTLDEQYVISGDRDEHIRASHYPNGYDIETFCLGHQEFITSLHIPSFTPQTLISGSGDSYLLFWDWKSGKPIQQLDLEQQGVIVPRIVSHDIHVAVAQGSSVFVLSPTDSRGRCEIAYKLSFPSRVHDICYSNGKLLVSSDKMYIYSGQENMEQDPLLNSLQQFQPLTVDTRDQLPLENLRKGTNYGKSFEAKPRPEKKRKE